MSEAAVFDGKERLKQAVERDVKKEGSRCLDKFNWVLKRADHYAEKTGLSAKEILDAWEKDRDYWYMNYYQESNQPLIGSDKVKVFDTVQELLDSIGKEGFRCPCCGGVSKSPYECTSGIVRSDKKVCDWKSYGLFGTLGKGVYVFVKEKIKGERMFMPVSWEGSKSDE